MVPAFRPVPALSPEDVARFWASVRRDEGCWEWQGRRTEKGYGLFSLAGRHYLAHRVACALLPGGLTAEQVVLHDCDNPPCVRAGAGHVHPGTQGQNMRDRAARGRHWTAAGVARSRFTEAEREAIRTRYPATSVREMAREYGVSYGVIGLIVWGEAWYRRRFGTKAGRQGSLLSGAKE